MSKTKPCLIHFRAHKETGFTVEGANSVQVTARIIEHKELDWKRGFLIQFPVLYYPWSQSFMANLKSLHQAKHVQDPHNIPFTDISVMATGCCMLADSV